jgi:hypothetical protein
MELHAAELGHIRALVSDWKTSPEIELEATFGFKGVVDLQTFLRVVSRLKAKGFSALPQDERITIGLEDSLRFTINGQGEVAKYCRDNRIAGKPFVAIIKDRSISKENEDKANLDLKEYNVRIKARREKPLAADDVMVREAIQRWDTVRKYFRIIRRWTFKDEKKGIKFDLSMVRSTPRGTQVRFQDQNLLSAIPTYEIEVELDRAVIPEDATVDEVRLRLLQGIGEILRGIQGTPLLIRNSVKTAVLEEYRKVTGTEKFRGVAPVTLQRDNMAKEIDPEVHNIRSGYNVTDKADGLRVHAFVTESGELFMIDMTMNVYKTGLKKPECKHSLLDGEYVTNDKEGKGIQDLLLFDMYYKRNGNDVSGKGFNDDRYPAMQEWIAVWNNDGGPTKELKTASLNVALKMFYIAEGDDIFAKAASVLDNHRIRNYKTDGLIFTPNATPIPSGAGVGWDEQFKWKPAKDNTIDFLVSIEKDIEYTTQDKITVGINPQSQESMRYKTLRLFVSSREDPAKTDPRATILNQLPIGPQAGGLGPAKPVLFNPTDYPDTMANVCYLETLIDPDTSEEIVTTEQTEEHAAEPIRDNSIVEMRYDGTKPAGWRWIPLRIRSDKTDRLAKAKEEAKKARVRGERGPREGIYYKTMNSARTANDNWNSIQNPVTEQMIRRGLEEPTPEEQKAMGEAIPVAVQKKYFERKAETVDLQKVRGLRDFHNKYIKDQLLYGAVFAQGEGKKLLDLAVGKAADLQRWRRGRIGFALGVDAAGENIRDPKNGAYARLLSSYITKQKFKDRLPLPPMFFCIANSARPLVDGTAGETEEEKNILRSIFGRAELTGPIPKMVEEAGAGRLRSGADVVVCMFALHYFFETEAMFDGLLQNIADTLKVGGYFAGTNFDGKAVFDLLRDKKKGESRVGIDGESILWEITKDYEADELPIDDSAFGMPIDVNFITIGAKHREYLVPWELLVAKMATIGCELVPADELKAMGLQKSTNMFEVSYQMAKKAEKTKYNMPKAVEQFSFLNRWYIFKRTSLGAGRVGDVATAGVAAARSAEVAAAAEGLSAEAKAELLALSAATQAAIPEAGEALGAASLAAAASLASRRLPADGALAVEAVELAVGGPGPAPGAPVARTVPVDETIRSLLDKKTFTKAELFTFKETSVEFDKTLKLPERYASYAARWMAPNAPFRIIDPVDSEEFPSVLHFMLGMKFKYASGAPGLATTIFSVNGIHQSYTVQRLEASKKGTLTAARDRDLLEEETKEIERTARVELKKKAVKFDEGLWTTKKQGFLEEAVRQRLQRDKKFCVIADAALTQDKYLLYEDTKTSELGGVRTITGAISGENMYGRMIMQLAASDPETLKACLALPEV